MRLREHRFAVGQHVGDDFNAESLVGGDGVRHGYHVGVDADKFLFGEAARKNLLAETERELAGVAQRIDDLLEDFSTLKKQQAERIVKYRQRRRPMPQSWYSRQSLAELRDQHESPGEVKREIDRLRK